VGKRYVGPTYGFAASPKVGSGATVGTLLTGYRRIEASSQDMEQCVHLLTAMYHVAPDLTSLPMWALALPRVPRPRTSPPCRGGIQCCHMSRGPRPHLLADMTSNTVMCPSSLDLASLPRWAPVLPHVPLLWALPPRGGSSSGATCPTSPSRLWTIGIKKGLAALVMQLDSHVSKIRSRVTEAPARRVDRRRHHNLQDM
jgi:hypothetical protein